MSIVSNKISTGNPITDQHVVDLAKDLGFTVPEAEIDPLRELLAATHDTFEELSKHPDYNLPTDVLRFPRRDVRLPRPDEDAAWACRFGIRDARKPGTSGSSTLPKQKRLLEGRTLVLKDNICVANIPQYNGTDAIPPSMPLSDATIVTRLLEAGVHIVGTATCEAFSCATNSNTSFRGPISNPWAPDYTTGGSSSGVAALVGRQEPCEDGLVVDMGIGADQGGSIRVPAAFCGLVGFKATHGLIPYTGVVTCEPVLDHVGPLAKSVWDVALLLEVLAGKDFIDDRQIGASLHGQIPYSSQLQGWHKTVIAEHKDTQLRGKRVALLKEATEAPFVTDDMKAELYRVKRQFESLGAQVDEISLPGHELGRSLWLGVCRQSLSSVALGHPVGRRGYFPTGFSESLLPWSQEKWEKLPIGMRNELINGRYEQTKYPHLYEKCMNLALQLTRQYEDLFQTYDVLLLPTTPFTAPKQFDRSTATPREQIASTFGQTLNTVQFNLTGHPAMSLPTALRKDVSGIDPDIRLPVSVQLVAALHGEAELLRFGYAYEKAYNWKESASE